MQGTNHTKQFTLFTDLCLVSTVRLWAGPSIKGEAGFAKSQAQETVAHKQIVQKESGHYYASFAKQTFFTTTLPKLLLK